MSTVSNTAGNAAVIGSHIATMIAENANVGESKIKMGDKYTDYLADNQLLKTDWEGDTAKIFMMYSNCANKILKATIGTTNVLWQDIGTFYELSKQADEQAMTNAEGGK